MQTAYRTAIYDPVIEAEIEKKELRYSDVASALAGAFELIAYIEERYQNTIIWKKQSFVSGYSENDVIVLQGTLSENPTEKPFTVHIIREYMEKETNLSTFSKKVFTEEQLELIGNIQDYFAENKPQKKAIG